MQSPQVRGTDKVEWGIKCTKYPVQYLHVYSFCQTTGTSSSYFSVGILKIHFSIFYTRSSLFAFTVVAGIRILFNLL